VAYPILSTDETFHTVVSFSESAVWLIDVLGDMQAIRNRYGHAFPASPLHILQKTIQIERALSRKTGVSASVHKKAVTLLILLCGDIATSLNASTMLDPGDEETRRTYVLSLAIITAASVEDRSIGRLAISNLVDESSMFYSAMPEGTDIWVWYHLQLLYQLLTC
jgi:serine/threonine-protein kinase ATR